MKIYERVIPGIAKEIVKVLVENKDIELEIGLELEAQRDFEAILKEYTRTEKELADYANDIVIARGWPRAKYSEARRLAAASRKVPLDDDAVDYVINQMLEFMLISANIGEVYAEDHTMRKRIVTVLRRYLKMDEELDLAVRGRLRHLQEGTRDWEISYKKNMEEMRRIKGLT